MELRISDYEDYLANLPEGLQKRVLMAEYQDHITPTKVSQDDESYQEACDQASERYESQCYESSRANAQE